MRDCITLDLPSIGISANSDERRPGIWGCFTANANPGVGASL